MAHFEGPEKKIEIILAKPQPNLRYKSDGRWRRVVRASGAEILNCVSTAELDGYLLSESSLFVWEDRLLLITCGRTTPVQALPEILGFIDRDKIAFLFYERKNLNFPGEQTTGVEDDFSFLSEFFPCKTMRFGSGDRDHVHLFYYGNGEPASLRHTTLRVLMHDIDPSVGQCFTHTSHGATNVRDMFAGLSLVNASMVLDTHFFNPQGYSLNGLFEGGYLTVHVTPEPEASYTSLETNIVDPDGCRIIDEITRIFKPARFCIFLKTGDNNPHGRLNDILPTDLPGFGLEESGHHRLDRHFNAVFQCYRRNDEFT